jgi:putative pyruvate formate lyase activating enzyme
MNNFDFSSCQICGRICKVNRVDNFSSFCKADQNIYISSIFVHKGEEPPFSGDTGICNVFFAHCNLQCVYCQNYQISNNYSDIQKFRISLEQATEKIISILDSGVQSVGFVSPSHFVAQTIDIIDLLHQKGYYPTIVYNTNAYDSVKTLKILENYVDIICLILNIQMNKLL